MTTDSNKTEPSMDDILASIRKIISDDEARAQVSNAANAQPGPGDLAPSDAKPASLARGTRANLGNRDDVLLLTDLIEEPKLGSAGPRSSDPEPPIPLPRIDPVRAAEMPQPSIDPAPESPAAPLVASVVAGVTSSAFDRLSQAVKQSVPEPAADEPGPNLGGGGKTIEEVVKEMLRPMLKDWLDRNLPPMVERMVEREIVRLTRR